jgi:protocatechuate 3,4-dioxygenase, alpha subunit
MPGTTPSQTVGPYLSIGLPWPDGPQVVAPGTPGAIRIGGHLLDGAGDPVPDGLIETWQADPHGRFDHPDDPRGRSGGGFRGFGRAATDEDGAWEIVTLKPGPVPGLGDTMQAPHIAVSVFARGLLNRVVTRIYFGDEPEANAADPLLADIADAAARATLIAEPVDGGYRFDIHLQGPHETVFLAI